MMGVPKWLGHHDGGTKVVGAADRKQEPWDRNKYGPIYLAHIKQISDFDLN